MRKLVATSVMALLVAACSPAPKESADPATAARRAEWASLADLPDLSGVWEVDWANKRGTPPRPAMKLQPEYQARLDAFKKAQEKGENLQTQGANCVPPGLPGIMTQPYPIEFAYQPGKIIMVIEAYMQFRHIYTDGRKLPEDPDLTYMGSSIGRWEGDTLVIQSSGFKEDTLLAAGVPHSEQLTIVERIRRVDKDWMEIETTMTDPVVLAEPYTVTISYRHLDDEIREYICLENNRDGADEKGRPLMNLE
jgi:hypothetical protein